MINIGKYIEMAINWLTENFAGLFDVINPIPQIKSKPSKVRTAVPFPAFHQAKATIPTIIR